MKSYKQFISEDSTIAGGALGCAAADSHVDGDPYKINYANNDARWIFGKSGFPVARRIKKKTKRK